MESACEVNPTSNMDNCESQSLKNQGNIYGGWGFLLHQSSKPESTITSKTIEFERIERNQDYCRRRSKIITRHGMLKVALSTFLILLIISTSLSIFLIMTPEEFFKPNARLEVIDQIRPKKGLPYNLFSLSYHFSL